MSSCCAATDPSPDWEAGHGTGERIVVVRDCDFAANADDDDSCDWSDDGTRSPSLHPVTGCAGCAGSRNRCAAAEEAVVVVVAVVVMTGDGVAAVVVTGVLSAGLAVAAGERLDKRIPGSRTGSGLLSGGGHWVSGSGLPDPRTRT